MQQLLDFFDRLSDQAPRFALPKLALELDYRSIGPVEAPGQDRGDVKGDDRIDRQRGRQPDLRRIPLRPLLGREAGALIPIGTH